MNRNDQQFIAQKIRSQYIEKQPSELDELRRIDTKVKRPVNVFSYIFGSVSAIIMGAGMSLVMTDLSAQLGLGDMTAQGIVIGIIGLIMAIFNYPMHKHLMRARREKFAPEILAASDKIINK